ncbi:Thioesterase superfamily protein [Cryptosporidium meleagridis]|uniref:Thioesterase superfamily protein n=1 Tax=Cryptosporidium meleagridis TaxID=93969 RepID=A0A2P4Z5A0_9CRYT|nr:Thioesterase superfamily protein [Cryptosporidium meleagridis]
MEKQTTEHKLHHQSIPSTVSTSTDSIDIDSLSPKQVESDTWLDKILSEKGILDITKDILSLVNDENKLINTFNKSCCIISTKIYLRKQAEKPPSVISVIELGKNIESHSNVVHGGFSATLVDNCLGILAAQLYKFPVTKTLNLAYKKPILPGQTIVIISKVKDSEQENNESMIQSDRCTLISEIFSMNQDILLSSEAVFVDISGRVKK